MLFGVNETAINAFFDELEAIEKDAGLKDLMKGLKARSKKTSELAKKLGVRTSTHPHVQKVLKYIQDPMNTADLAQSLSNLSRFVS